MQTSIYENREKGQGDFMAIYAFAQYIPQCDTTCFVADTAAVIGRVVMGKNSSIWYSSVARGDVNQITIGENTNVQDLSMLHVTEETPLLLKENVTVGHSVTLHGCTIEKNALIGMGAVVLDGAHIGEFSIVAAGSVVPPGKKYPPRSLILGAPAKVIREITDGEYEMLCHHFQNYIGYKNQFQTQLKRLD